MLRARSRFVCSGGVDDGGGGEGFCGEPNGLSVMVVVFFVAAAALAVEVVLGESV